MNRNRFSAASSAAVLAGALAMTGCASTAAKTSATSASAVGTPAATATQAQAAVSGKVHIMIYSINSDGPDFRVILTGAVGDYGPAVTVYPDGKVDPGHTSEMELELTHGSFRLGIAGIDKKVISAYRHWPSNASTCSGTITFTAAAPILAGSGTGRYRRISGSLGMTVTIDEVDVKPVCNGTSRFLWQVVLMAGSGTVSS